VAAQGTPALDGDDGVGLLVGAAGDADLLAGRLGVGLAAPQAQDQAALGEGDVLPIEGGDLGASQGAGEAEEQDAVVTEVTQGDLGGGGDHGAELGHREGGRLGAGGDAEAAPDPAHHQADLELLGGRWPDPRCLVGQGDGGQLELDPGGAEGQLAAADAVAGLGEVAEVAGDGAGRGGQRDQLLEGAPALELLPGAQVLGPVLMGA
jgi:hypothetical protein